MNKQQYKEVLRLRKIEESYIQTMVLNGVKPRQLRESGVIPPKRLWYLLDKWSNNDLYDWGVNFELGWIYQDKIDEYWRTR